jgi:hypothetical protein
MMLSVLLLLLPSQLNMSDMFFPDDPHHHESDPIVGKTLDEFFH